jgi:hypothetical protein
MGSYIIGRGELTVAGRREKSDKDTKNALVKDPTRQMSSTYGSRSFGWLKEERDSLEMKTHQ